MYWTLTLRAKFYILYVTSFIGTQFQGHWLLLCRSSLNLIDKCSICLTFMLLRLAVLIFKHLVYLCWISTILSFSQILVNLDWQSYWNYDIIKHKQMLRTWGSAVFKPQSIINNCFEMMMHELMAKLYENEIDSSVAQIFLNFNSSFGSTFVR